MARRRLTIMSVFLPRENLFFLEEWVLYHLRLGVDHVCLYNNAGSRDLRDWQSVEVTGRNRHGIDVRRLLAHLDDAAVDDRLRRILAPYIAAGQASLVPWQPRDAQGAITFGQPEAYVDYITRFSAGTEWTAFIDLDEFLVTPLYGTLPPLLADLETDGVQVVRLEQHAFPCRFTADGEPVANVLAQTRCDPTPVTHYWDLKSMVRSAALTVPAVAIGDYVHYPPVRDDAVWFSAFDVLHFNHYRYNPAVIAAHEERTARLVTLEAENDEMLRHLPWIAAHRHSSGGRAAGQRSRARSIGRGPSVA